MTGSNYFTEENIMEEKLICSHCGEIIDNDDHGQINGEIIFRFKN